MSSKENGLAVVWLNVSDLIADPSNARLHDDKNIEAIRGSLRRFGFQKPLVVDSDLVVRAGNGTLRAAIAENYETVPVVISELDNVDMTAFAITDNRTSELAEWDQPVLDDQLRALLDEEFDLEVLGFDDADLKLIFAETAEDDDDDPPVNESFNVMLTCQNEAQQLALIAEFEKRGIECRALIS